jgi:hypothetical protein
LFSNVQNIPLMDKKKWVSYAAPACQGFLEVKAPKHIRKLQAVFGNRMCSDSVGKDVFQKIYDLVSSWSCWGAVPQDEDWSTVVRYEVLPTQLASSVPDQEESMSLSLTSHFIETDQDCTDVQCYTVTPINSSPVHLSLKSSPDITQLSKIKCQSLLHNKTHFKLTNNATYANVEVIKRKVFTVVTHFRWQYEFSLVWSSPYIEDRENATSPLVFQQDPKCQFRITCNFLDDDDHGVNETKAGSGSGSGSVPNISLPYLSESFLMKVHECIPASYRAPDGTSVSIPSSDHSVMSTMVSAED